MKTQKVRGQKRLQAQIERWKQENLDLRFDLIQEYNSDHIDIVIHPWCDISIINSRIPEPKGKIKELMMQGLFDIYDSWKRQLDETGQLYYLKIWIYNPRFSKSQVVCAVGDGIPYYENVFLKPDNIKVFPSNNYNNVKGRLSMFDWDHWTDEDHYDSNEVGEPELYRTLKDYKESKKWFNRMVKKRHRTTKLDETTEQYSFRRGDIWIGSSK